MLVQMLTDRVAQGGSYNLTFVYKTNYHVNNLY